VRAVNLIPAEQRRSSSGPGRSGGAVYVLLGGLALLLVAVAVYVLTVNQVNDNKDQLSRLQSDTQTAQAQANALSPYRKFAALKAARLQTISSLAQSRFDWEQVMRKLAIVIPSDVWLTSLVGTVSPDVQVQASTQTGDGSSGLRAAMPVPALELTGCTTGQAQVSRFMSRLRVIDGVSRVSLASSEKSDSTAGGGSANHGSSPSGASGSGDCRNGSSKYPQFDLVVFFGDAVK
jgi:Tfp pilus assembly protein PilN